MTHTAGDRELANNTVYISWNNFNKWKKKMYEFNKAQ